MTDTLNVHQSELTNSNESLNHMAAEVRELEIPGDPFLGPAKVQVLNHLRHANFAFSVREGDEDYPHALPTDEGVALMRKVSAQKAEDLLGAAHGELPFRFEASLLSSGSADEARQAQAEATRRVIDQPIESYHRLRRQLQEGGLEAPVTDLRYTLEYLVHSLLDDAGLQESINQSSLLGGLRSAALGASQEVLERAAEDGGVPYLSANLAIERCIEVLDVYSRGQEEAPALYHSDRYEYYLYNLLSDPNHVTLPTPADLTSTDLLRVRGVPIGLVGANAGRMRVDGFVQTPYEFFQHDVNHSRRMYQFFSEYASDHNLSLEELAMESTQLLGELLPVVELDKDDSEEQKNTKIWARMLLFEMLHEDALPAQKDVLLKALFRPELQRTPFEQIDKQGNVEYVMEEGATTLAYLFRKMKHDFYDIPDRRSDALGDEDFRSRYAAVEAAVYLLGTIEPTLLAEEGIIDQLEQLVATDEGFPDAYFETVQEDIRRRIGSDNSFEMLVSIPGNSAKAIEAIKGIGKRIVTLYGFSDLGYEDPAALRQAVESMLDTYNPSETAIAIGATDVGIGQAYEYAKARGFQTVGIVSTKALAHGGKFSTAVDQIHLVKDPSWGGYLPDGSLAETTNAFISTADAIHAFGGGEITAAALRQARELGIPVTFTDLKPQKADSPTPARDYWQTAAQ